MILEPELLAFPNLNVHWTGECLLEFLCHAIIIYSVYSIILCLPLDWTKVTLCSIIKIKNIVSIHSKIF
jgi:hypothetical protein